jgi:hypothetical protein
MGGLLMDRDIARGLIDRELEALRKLSYKECLQLMDRVSTKSLPGPDGKEYQLEIQACWDSKKNGNIRVSVAASGGGLSVFVPAAGDFIISPDGSFVGENSH